MAIFVGEHSATVDDKGRIVLPAAFKKAMGEMALEFVILEKNRIGKCLDIHTEETWSENVRKFKKKLNPLNPKHDKLLQVYFQNFIRIGVSANGRINVPNGFMEFANLKKAVKFIGMFTSIRLIDASDVSKPDITDDEYLEMLNMLNGEDDK